MFFNLLSSLLWLGLAKAVPYSQYILAPSSRTITPQAVHKINGTADGAQNLVNGGSGSVTLANASSITLDFGKNIAGVASMNVGSTGSSSIALTYTESSLWINGEACDGTADAGLDAPYLINTTGPGTYSVDRDYERGGFQYLSLINRGTGSVEISNITVNFTAMPQVQDLKAYAGYFHSNDDKINRVSYAGAYTNQLCTIDPAHGNSLVHIGVVNATENISLPTTETWYLNSTIGNGSSVLTDGAKRDRLVWPGDMSISAPGIFVSTNDMDTIRNSLESLLILQNATTGQLPYVGTPLAETFSKIQGSNGFSFTYHMYSLIGMSYYYTFTGDSAWIQTHWSNFTAGLNFSLSQIDSSGLMNVTFSADWLRSGMGGHNIEANAILYYTIQQGIMLAQDVVNDTATASSWATKGESIKAAANRLLWNPSGGYFTDNETTTLAPQDGNAWAIKANLTQSANQTASISQFLHSRWTPYGPPAPEAHATVSPFISGFELEAHFLASDPDTALELVRYMWADFMLDDARMTNSTFIEGYSTDGSLHYAPYSNDPRVSHAHGWATGPTSVLTFYVAGLHLEAGMGRSWRVQPQVGNLSAVDAGIQTPLGAFTSTVSASGGVVTGLNFSAPEGTSGSVVLGNVGGGGTVSVSGPGKNVTVQVAAGSGGWSMDGLQGGNWSVTFRPSGNGTVPAATAAAGRIGADLGVAVGLACMLASLLR